MTTMLGGTCPRSDALHRALSPGQAPDAALQAHILGCPLCQRHRAFGVGDAAGITGAVGSTQVHTTVDGDVGLSESSGGSQASDGQSNNLLLHQKISLVVSFWYRLALAPSFTSRIEKLASIVAISKTP